MQQIVPAITDETRFTVTALGAAALASAKAKGNAPALPAEELRSFLNATAEDARRGRTLVNIARRAETLFEDGYTVDTRRDGQLATHFTLRTPKGDFYGVCVTKGDDFGQYCTCPAFAEHDTCKHMQACQLLLDEEAYLEAQAEHATLVADYFDEWQFAQGF